jgi:hypothetical protein
MYIGGPNGPESTSHGFRSDVCIPSVPVPSFPNRHLDSSSPTFEFVLRTMW